jgi:hypothetical protein
MRPFATDQPQPGIASPGVKEEAAQQNAINRRSALHFALRRKPGASSTLRDDPLLGDCSWRNLPVQPKTASSRLPGRPPYTDGMVTISAQAYPIGQPRDASPERSLLDDGAAGKVVTLRSEIKHAPDDEEHHRN